MKERPILMSAPMVRALLSGTKTQTRRAVKPSPFGVWPMTTNVRSNFVGVVKAEDGPRDHCWNCPYGNAGDLLWVRETFAEVGNVDPPWVLYRANGYDNECRRHRFDNPPPESEQKWRPAIFMPRALSRLTLRITKVRVHRLVDISEEDACAEGWPNLPGAPLRDAYPIGWYANLWDDINGRGSYEANPWVWALTFERVPLREAAGG
jgi:hypothetical protein